MMLFFRVLPTIVLRSRRWANAPTASCV